MKLVSRPGIWFALRILFWPAFVVVALNIENWAARLGLSSILADNAGSIMGDILGFIRSAWVQIPALLIVGGAVALWVDRRLKRGEVALIEAEAKLTHETRMADKGKRTSHATESLSPQPVTDVIFPPTVTQHDPPPFKGENLYTGLIIVSAGQLEERRAIEIAMRCFNGSGNAIFIQRVEGKITVNEMPNGSSKPIGDLPLPWLSDKAKQREIQPSEEFLVLLEQRVTEEIAGKIASIGPGPAIGFDFDGLNILIGSHFWPENLQRLPLWNGVRISRNAEQLQCGRITTARIEPIKIKIN